MALQGLVWHPSSTGVTLSPNGLLATCDDGSFGTALSETTFLVSDDNIYFEILVTDPDPTNSRVGVYCGSPGYYLDSEGYYTDGTTKLTNLSLPYGDTDIVMVAVNSSGKVWFGVNNVWSGDPAAGTGEVVTISTSCDTYIRCMLTSQSSNESVTLNATSDRLAYSPPSGFTALDDIFRIFDSSSANTSFPTLPLTLHAFTTEVVSALEELSRVIVAPTLADTSTLTEELSRQIETVLSVSAVANTNSIPYLLLLFQDSAVVNTSVIRKFMFPLTSELSLSDTSSYQVLSPISDTVTLNESWAINAIRLFTVSDEINATTVLMGFRKFVVEEAVAANDTTEATLQRLLAFADTLIVSGVATSRLQALQITAEAVVASATAGAGILLSFLDSINAADLNEVQKTQYLMAILDTVDASATLTNTYHLRWILTDTIEASDVVDTSLVALLRLEDEVVLGGAFNLDGEVYNAWVMNTETYGGWKYDNYPFTGFTECDGKYFGVTEDGVYELTGDTDNGVDIDAVVKSGLLDFGISAKKRVTRSYLYLSKEGRMLLTVDSVTNGQKSTNWYEVDDLERDFTSPEEVRVKLHRGIKSVNRAFELRNVDGGDFDVRGWEVYVVVLSRRV